MSETGTDRAIDWPPGRMDFRKMRNLKPGQIIAPVAWAQGYREGVFEGEPWGTVKSYPLTMTLEDILTRRRRKVTSVLVEMADGEVERIEGDPNDDVRIIVPPKTKASR